MSLWKVLTARWGSGAGETDEVRIDASTNSLQTVSYAHHEVHGGSHFTFSYTDADFDIADAVEFMLVVPNTTKWPHVIFDIEAALDTTVELWENTTAAGHTVNAAQLVYNNNRNSATVNTTTVNTHNDDGADGTMIFSSVFGISTGGGVNKVTGGGASRAEQEWVLKQNYKYTLKVTSGTDDSSMSMKLSWYEHTDKH